MDAFAKDDVGLAKRYRITKVIRVRLFLVATVVRVLHLIVIFYFTLLYSIALHCTALFLFFVF
jgi:hypothetical protein